MVPRVAIIAGKAAPGYAMAKLILRFICRVADVVNQDPAASGRLKVAFLPDYNVTLAQRLIPAADLSEQISTAGCEASGTGNMKFAMNGALTIGTLDGANVEMRDAIGHDRFFLFGHTADEIAALRGSYDPKALLAANAEIASALALLADGSLSPEDPGLFLPLYDALVGGDRYFLLADLPAWLETQDRVDRLYANPARVDAVGRPQSRRDGSVLVRSRRPRVCERDLGRRSGLAAGVLTAPQSVPAAKRHRCLGREGRAECRSSVRWQQSEHRPGPAAEAWPSADASAKQPVEPAARHGLRSRRLGPREVDEAALDVGRDELHAHAVADVEAVAPAHDLPLDGGLADPHPGALRATRR